MGLNLIHRGVHKSHLGIVSNSLGLNSTANPDLSTEALAKVDGVEPLIAPGANPG